LKAREYALIRPRFARPPSPAKPVERWRLSTPYAGKGRGEGARASHAVAKRSKQRFFE
jgi:hypothetical protein